MGMNYQRSFKSDCHQSLCKFADLNQITQIKTQIGMFIEDPHLFLVNLIYCDKFERKYSAFHCDECKSWIENTIDKQSIENHYKKMQDAYYKPDLTKIFIGMI